MSCLNQAKASGISEDIFIGNKNHVYILQPKDVCSSLQMGKVLDAKHAGESRKLSGFNFLWLRRASQTHALHIFPGGVFLLSPVRQGFTSAFTMSKPELQRAKCHCLLLGVPCALRHAENNAAPYLFPPFITSTLKSQTFHRSTGLLSLAIRNLWSLTLCL